MKNFLKGLLVGFSFIAFPIAAMADHHASNGKIFYKLGDDIVTRQSTLEMKKDETTQKATFTLKSSDWTVTSQEAFMKEKRGGTIAYIAFENAWPQKDGNSVHLLFKGTKIEGSNRVIYQGNVLKVTQELLDRNGETLAECIAKLKDTGVLDEEWQIAGTFWFSKDKSPDSN